MWKKSSSSKWLWSWNLRPKLDLAICFQALLLVMKFVGLILVFFNWVLNTKIESTMKKILNFNNILLLLPGRTIKSMVLGFRSTFLVHFTMPTPQGIKQWESKVKDNLSWKTKECSVRESLLGESGVSNSRLTYFQRCIWLLLVHDIYHRGVVKQW